MLLCKGSFGYAVSWGMADNIIPNAATLMGTVRSFNQTLRKEAEERIEQVVKGITKAHGGIIHIRIDMDMIQLLMMSLLQK